MRLQVLDLLTNSFCFIFASAMSFTNVFRSSGIISKNNQK